MARSALSSYKREVRYRLLRIYKWRAQEASMWVNENKNYLRSMMHKSCPSFKTAEIINNREKVNI